MKNLAYIHASYHSFFKAKRTQTFNKCAQQMVDPDFHARGIFAKYNMSYYKFMDKALVKGSEYDLEKLYGVDAIGNWRGLLEVEVSKDKNLQKLMSEFNYEDASVAVVEPVEEPAVINGEDLWKLGTDSEQEGVTEVPAVVEPEPAQMYVSRETPAEVVPETVKVEAKKEKVSAGFNLNIDLGSIINQAAVDYLESPENNILAYLEKRIQEESNKLKPAFAVQVNGGNLVPMQGRVHKMFQETLELAIDEKQVYLAGPAGSGKTTLCSQLATALQVKFAHISCTAGMSEAHLLGRMVADGSYVSAEFVELYENGGVFLFDEVDAADPNTLLIINSALANGYMVVPNRKDQPRSQRHPDFIAVCAANTWGSGSNEYAGRNPMDAAFLDRFAVSKVEVDYDVELEAEILKDHKKFATALWTIRENIKKNRVRRVVSTRVFVSAARQLNSGKTPEQILNRFFTGWTTEEKTKAIYGVETK